MSSSYVPVESLLASSAFRRLLAVSLVGHVAVFLALVLRPHSDATLIASAPVMVHDGRHAQAGARAARGEAAGAEAPREKPKPPEPEPPPPPPKPVVKEIVIPKEPAPLQKPKPGRPRRRRPRRSELLAKMTERVEQQEAAKRRAAARARGDRGPQAPLAPARGRLRPALLAVDRPREDQGPRELVGRLGLRGEAMPIFNVDVDADGALSDIELSAVVRRLATATTRASARCASPIRCRPRRGRGSSRCG